jgi:hypothetical protein
MDVKPRTLEFLRELERSSNQKLNFPKELAHLLDAARQHQKMDAFEEAIFLAKFITKSAAIMRRIGPDGEGFDKLSAEVESGIQKTSQLLSGISASCPDEAAKHQAVLFFSMSHETLDRLMKLFADLTLVKNWVLDKKPLP